MAINLKPDPAKGWKTCALFNVSPDLIAQAKARDIVVISTTPGVYTIKSKSKVFANVSVKTTAITLVEQKALGPGSIEQYKFAFEQGLKDAIKGTPVPAGAIAAAAEADDPEPSIVTGWGGLKAKTEPASADKPQPATVTNHPLPVPLKDATLLYQAVHGTNPASIYYTFAFFPGLKLAARINGTKLSVRAEGEKLDQYVPTLKSQFKLDANIKGYASAHYAVAEGKDLIVKALAAIVGVIGFQKAEKVADLNKFVIDQLA